MEIAQVSGLAFWIEEGVLLEGRELVIILSAATVLVCSRRYTPRDRLRQRPGALSASAIIVVKQWSEGLG